MFKYTNMFLDMKDKSKVTEKIITNVRQEFYNMPKRLFLFFVGITLVLIIAIFVVVPMSIVLKAKFALIYFMLFLLSWVISVTIIRRHLIKVLEKTYIVFPKYEFLKQKQYFHTNVLTNLIPIFVSITFIIMMLGYSFSLSKNGDKIYEYYSVMMKNADYNGLTESEVLDRIKEIEKYNEKDYYFIAYKDRSKIITEDGFDEKGITNFLLEYANDFIKGSYGRSYEYFGVEAEAFVHKAKLADGREAYIGFKYSISDNTLFTNFVIIAAATLTTYIIIITIWARNMSYTLRKISGSLQTISKNRNVQQHVILPIYSYDEIGSLAHSYNEIQKINNERIKKIKDEQESAVERERLSSLGAMIGGIAHNLKTPILSIAGALEGINDLANEMEESLVTPTVTMEDKKEILGEQREWVSKSRKHLEYMSDMITAVKGQAVSLSEKKEEKFDVDELLKLSEILMSHKAQNQLIELTMKNNIKGKPLINGNINSLVQILNNVIVNAIESYGNRKNEKVEVFVNLDEKKKHIVISVRDHGAGMSKDLQEKLFRQMVTTKGKEGTGLRTIYVIFYNKR